MSEGFKIPPGGAENSRFVTPENQTPEQENHEREHTSPFPEITSNPRREDTTLVYSIPFMKEWKNGNLLRMLQSFLAQDTKSGESFEVELIANIGDKLHSLLIEDSTTRLRPEVASIYDGTALPETRPFRTKAENEEQQRALDALSETSEAALFIRKIVKAQALIQKIRQNIDTDASEQELETLRQSVVGTLEQSIFEKAVERAEQVSFVLIDATKTTLENTDYNCYTHISIGALRTLGLDIAATRFEGKENTVISLYDADTVPENNRAIRDTQQIFDNNPRLTYMFSGLANAVPGTSKEFLASGPSANLKQVYNYNAHKPHGSPQIAFRFSAYKKLQEISGFMMKPGFHGDEDRDTSIRLTYHFGDLQEGLLFEKSLDEVMPPTMLTGDRADGFVDSVSRVHSLEKGHFQTDISGDLQRIFNFRDEILEMTQQEPPERQAEVHEFLEQARVKYLKKEKLQQRMNRLVARSFLQAVKQNFIRLNPNNELEIDEIAMKENFAGTALLQYVKGNRLLIQEILQTPNDLDVMEYFVGIREELPIGVTELTPFQAAIREYVGTIPKTAELLYTEKNPKDLENSGWEVVDQRTVTSPESLMHPMIAESLALGATYRTFFETKTFLKSRDSFRTEGWPKNPDEQKLNFHFGNPEERKEAIKRRLTKIETRQIEAAPVETQNLEVATEKAAPRPSWFSRINIRSFPIAELFKRLFP